ncbi:MAG: pyridoxal phosphate-dependent aminotransferase [Lachnospiraceae bacterium]|nr:pyridoxal phosphate-dependent aminotransferase [Lachnospiraceae bacterium]
MPERNLDFDCIVERRGTRSMKYDFAKESGMPEDVLPFWVADMDFKTTSYVEDALSDVVARNIYGYSNIKKGDGFFEAIAGWMKRHHNWDVKQQWHVHTPGVCFAISNAVRAYSNEGDAVIIQQPVYYPFKNIILQNNRKLVSNDLVYDENGHYTIDFDDFENKIKENQVKLFILCNPHNPVGRVWTKEELEKLGDICQKYHVIVFSDEIHFDFIWSGTHQIFQEIKPEYREFTITATAPSKTFNLAGAQQSNLFIPNMELKRKFITEYEISGLDEPNIFGITTTEAAYTYGDEWYEAVKKYIKANIDFVDDYIRENVPGVKVIPTEGTYLVWLDFKGTGIDATRLDDLMINKAKLWLDSGSIFGKTGAGFQRINVACPRSLLEEALQRIKNSLEEIRF